MAAGLVWVGLGLPWLRCPFFTITGYPCLTCGATRCTIAFLHGNLPLAWSWNPLALIALSAVALFNLYAVIVLVARGPRLRVIDWTSAEKKAVRVAVIVLILANWAYLLSHRGQY